MAGGRLAVRAARTLVARKLDGKLVRVVIAREMNCSCLQMVKMVPEESRPSSSEAESQRLRNACGA